MKRILVAEDNDSNYLLMTFILKGHFELLRAIDGQEAVDKATTEHPDLILMDLKMPKMDGLAATRQIKSLLPNMPIIALTANAFDSDRQMAQEAGCVGFLSKPVNREECMKLIKSLIGE
jgi:CheY-like chemotaxis protein